MVAYALKCIVVPGGKEFIVPLKVPNPEPLAALLSVTVGLLTVDQTTPLSVILAPPSEVTFPPSVADVFETDEAAVDVTVGAAILGGPTLMSSIQK